MANYYGANCTTVFQTTPAGRAPGNEYPGKKCSYFDAYTVPAGGIASGSVIYFFKPHKGFKARGGFIGNNVDLTNNTTLQVGIIGATDKFLAATNHGGGSAVKSALIPAAKLAAMNYEFDGDTWVVAVTGTGTAAAGAVISLELEGGTT